MIIPEHDREYRIYQRRMELIEILDSILKRDIALGNPTDDESEQVRFIAKQFADVANPCDVVACLKDAYKDKMKNWRPPTKDS